MSTRKIKTSLRGSFHRPRLLVYRSNRYLYTQIIDDAKQKTLVGISEKHLLGSKSGKISRLEKAHKLGLLTSQKALEKKIAQVVFDRRSYAYHGVVKAVAQGAREGGLKF